MFKKLKEKITEEVKISPQRFVEFTQSVSDRLQNSSTSDDNFFSIGEDDTNTSVDSNTHGFSSVQLMSPQERPRRSSVSSLASDISFLPKYEPGSVYHLQSDLDISASEVEDNASTASSQLGHLTKEQIYSAFQKSQMRYHKYRGRYTDLSRHYKDLERDITKMKSVLVETQDKAIRRVTELKEQCALEQKAKAHLESALRDDLDEKNYKIKSLQTKIDILQNKSNSNSLINIEESSNNSSENLENLTKYLNDSRKEIETLNAKIQELKAKSIVFQSTEQEYKSKISNLEKEIVQFSEREKENNLNLAQNKMELHNEILLKDNEMSNLKRDNEVLKNKLESMEAENKTSSNQKLENLQSQNKKLIEKVESLTQKCNNLESELLKMETYKREIKNVKDKDEERRNEIFQLEKVKDQLTKSNSELNESLLNERESYEKQISQLREDAKKGLISLEPKIREKIESEFNLKESELQQEFSKKIEELTSSNNTTKEIQVQLIEKDTIIKNITEELNETKSVLSSKTSAYEELEKNHLELIENCVDLRHTISNLEKDKITLDAQEEKVKRLEQHIKTLQDQLEISEGNYQKAEKELSNIKQALHNTNEQLRLVEERNKAMELQSSDSDHLLKSFEEEKSYLMRQFEQIKQELNKSIEVKNGEIKQLQAYLVEAKEKSSEFTEKHSKLEKELLEFQEQIRLLEEKQIAEDVARNETQLLNLKLAHLEDTNSKNSERFTEQCNNLSEELTSVCKELKLIDSDEDFNDFANAELMAKLNLMKDMCKKKEEFYTDILTQNSKLSEENKSRTQELENLQREVTSIHSSNKDFNTNINTLEGELNHSKNVIQEKEYLIKNLMEQSQENHNRIDQLEHLLQEERVKTATLLSDVSRLESSLREFEEKYRLLEEKAKLLDVTESEYGILELKLQKMEVENQQLSDMLEKQNTSVEKTNKEHLESLSVVKTLESRNLELQKTYEDKNAVVQDLNEQIKRLEGTINESENAKKVVLQELEDIRIINSQLKAENEAKDTDITKLSSDVAHLHATVKKQSEEFNNLLVDTQKLDVMVENIKRENVEAVQREKACQNELIIQVNGLESQLEDKTSKLEELANRVYTLESACKTEEEKCKIKSAEIEKFTKEIKSKTAEMKIKDQEIYILKEERDSVVEEINALRGEIVVLNQQISHRGNLDTQLVHSESERELLQAEREKFKEEVTELNIRIQQLSMDNRNVIEENQTLSQEKEELKLSLEFLKEQQSKGPNTDYLDRENKSLLDNIQDLTHKLNAIETENVKLKSEKKTSENNGSEIAKIQEDFYEIKEKCDNLFIENKNLKQEYNNLEEKCAGFGKIKEKLEAQISESESHYNDLLREKQLLEDEIQELKTSPVNCNSNSSRLDNLETLKKEQAFLSEGEKQHYAKEIDILTEKLTKYKSLDLTNKSSIEFYENELQKLKNQNDKLNRKLDETIVTLNHCAELSTSTEVEYLKNVLYNYMLGKESLVLARVIAAVCKFDPHQTELIMQKEQQKQTLLGHLGLI
ncbi:uncharacterized protein [Diabrotica undecimpunctata]|uniref:uncharacterized protein n=1 Tax=Diabrotica undecimpunctata TaxID=50387 RepID=UPI003B635C87